MEVNYIKAYAVPELEKNFKMTPHTKQLILQFESLGVGELMEIRISAERVDDPRRAMRKLRGRAGSAAKRGQGNYELTQRNNSLFVKRVS